MAAGSVGRVLHVLSQRPSLTGSGVTLDALVREAAAAGWEQRVVVGVPAGDRPAVGGLPPERIHALTFEGGDLDFPVPGMSDVMPYRSTRFSGMSPEQLGAYREAWLLLLGQVIDAFRPDVIHAHHLWIVSSLIKDVASGVPVVTQSHATGFRQMDLCPHLAREVARGCARNERFLVLRQGHVRELCERLGVAAERVEVVGPGYRQDLFRPGPSGTVGPTRRLIYAGKYSAAKGLPWLLDAFERLRAAGGDATELHVAGSGAGAEAEELEKRMRGMPGVVLHGRLSQGALAELLRAGGVFVLPSFYEGVPLVLVEAAACGCRVVATDLPGVREELAPALGDALATVPLPRLASVDRPDPRDLGAFVETLVAVLRASFDAEGGLSGALAESIAARYSWSAVFDRVERVWREGASDRC